jgi:hypothetical protein
VEFIGTILVRDQDYCGVLYFWFWYMQFFAIAGLCLLFSTVGYQKEFIPSLLVNFTGYCFQRGACILFSSFASKDRVICARQWLF